MMYFGHLYKSNQHLVMGIHPWPQCNVELTYYHVTIRRTEKVDGADYSQLQKYHFLVHFIYGFIVHSTTPLSSKRRISGRYCLVLVSTTIFFSHDSNLRNRSVSLSVCLSFPNPLYLFIVPNCSLSLLHPLVLSSSLSCSLCCLFVSCQSSAALSLVSCQSFSSLFSLSLVSSKGITTVSHFRLVGGHFAYDIETFNSKMLMFFCTHHF